MPSTDLSPALTDAQCVAACIDRVPKDIDRIIILYPKGSETACTWVGMSAEQAASYLYQVADAIVEQRIPLTRAN